MWQVDFTPEADKDIHKLDFSVRKQVYKGISKVSENPISKRDGGYGSPLGHVGKNNLTGFYKIKFKRIGIRVVYKLVHEHSLMKIIVVSARPDNECYDLAGKRKDDL